MRLLVIDNGHGLELARELGKYHEVYYNIPVVSALPKICDYITGFGFDEFVKIDELSKQDYDNADAIIFLDNGFGNIVDFLKILNKKVIGTPTKVELMEFNRIFLKKVLKEINIPFPRTYIFKGLQSLLNFLNRNKDKSYYLKLNRYRGSLETVKIYDIYQAKSVLLERFPILSEYLTFILEDEIKDGVEFGIDTFFNGEDYLRPLHLGIEIKGSGVIGKWMNSIPLVEDVLEKFKFILKKFDYRGAVSFEGIYSKEKGIYYFTDFCPRNPFPLSSLYIKNLANYNEIQLALLEKQNIEIKPIEPYNIMIYTYPAEETGEPLKLVYSDKIADYVVIEKAVKLDNAFYLINGGAHLWYAGSSYDDCLTMTKRMINDLNYYNMIYDAGVFESLRETIEGVKDIGIDF